MNERQYDEQVLRNYLLDALPEAATEKIDELSITDEQFAGRLESAENDLIDAYLQDALTGESLEKFKSYYLASPWRREKIPDAQALQDSAKRDSDNRAAQSAPVSASAVKQNSKSFFQQINIFAKPSTRGWAFAAAAVLLAALAGFWILNNNSNSQKPEIAEQRETSPLPIAIPSSRQNSENANKNEANFQPAQTPPKMEAPKTLPTEKPSPVMPSPAQPIVASFVLAPPARGASRIQKVIISKQTTDIALRLQLEPADYSAYRIALTDQSNGKNLWSSGTLKASSAGENKSLNIRLPAKILKPEIYALEVSGINSDGKAEVFADYPFRVGIK